MQGRKAIEGEAHGIVIESGRKAIEGGGVRAPAQK